MRGRERYTARMESERAGAATTLRRTPRTLQGEREPVRQPRHILLKADTKGQEQRSADGEKDVSYRRDAASAQDNGLGHGSAREGERWRWRWRERAMEMEDRRTMWPEHSRTPMSGTPRVRGEGWW